MSNTTIQKTQQGAGNFRSNSTQRNGKSTGSTSRPNGKSKFAQKFRVKANRPKPVAVKRGPVNTYTSVCCGLPASKPGCVKVDKKKALEQGLGSWHCSGCRKACRVSVSKFKAAEILKALDSVVNASVVPVSEVPLAS